MATADCTGAAARSPFAVCIEAEETGRVESLSCEDLESSRSALFSLSASDLTCRPSADFCWPEKTCGADGTCCAEELDAPASVSAKLEAASGEAV